MQPGSALPEGDDKEDARVVPLRRSPAGAGTQRSAMAAGVTHIRGTGGRMDPADILARLPRELGLMVVVFCVIFGLGAFAALRMPSAYTANASLLMQLGKDYVYDPLAGDAARGATATIDQVVQSEVEILNSTELKKRVIARVGYRAVLPDAPAYWNPKTDAQIRAADEAALKVMTAGLAIQTAPQTNVVRLSFKHANATSASLLLNSLIDEYQSYRLSVYADTIGPALQRQKAAFDQRLAAADTAYQGFLKEYGVGDFDGAKATYSKIYDQVTADLFTTGAQIATDRAKLSEVRGSLARLSPEMSIERDLDLSVPSRILALQQQRQEMLARYLPNSQPIRDLEGQIASLQALMNSGSGLGEKDHKLGSNPVYQDMLTQRMNLEAEIASLSGRQSQLQLQADEVTKKMQALRGIEAQYTNLSSERDALQANIRTFTQRIQENDAQREMTKGTDDAVRVVEKATQPDKPKSLKKPVLILAFLFAAFTALCAGVLRVVTRKGFASAAMAGKALDLPVLAQATNKAA